MFYESHSRRPCALIDVKNRAVIDLAFAEKSGEFVVSGSKFVPDKYLMAGVRITGPDQMSYRRVLLVFKLLDLEERSCEVYLIALFSWTCCMYGCWLELRP